MPLPTCGSIAGFPLQTQVALIYCALYERPGTPESMPSCECVEGLPLVGMLEAIYCIIYSETESDLLLPCECVNGAPFNEVLDAIYCAAYVAAGSPEDLLSCACVRGLIGVNERVDAIYCVYYTQAGSPAEFPSCDCVRGLPLQDKLSALYGVLISGDIPPVELATLRVAWDESTGDVDGYRVEYSVDNINWTVAGETPPDLLAFTITDLLWDTPYYARVFAFNSGGDSPASDVLLLWTATEFGPTNLTATTIDYQSVFVEYVDSITQPSNGGYLVRWKKTSDPIFAANDFVINAIGEQQATVSGLDPDTSYDFKAVTYNDNSANTPPQVNSESVSSNVASATTLPEQVAPTVVSLTIPDTANTLAVVFDENCEFGAGGNGGLTLSSTGGAVTVAYVSGAGTTTFIYSTSRAIVNGEVITATYVQPGNGIQDLVGNDLASFAAEPVTNDVPSSFLPTDIAGCVGWYDATQLALSNNDPVATWPDLSGNGNNLTQATAANRPLFKLVGIGGLASVQGDGINDNIGGAITNSAARYIGIVMQKMSAVDANTRTLACMTDSINAVLFTNTGFALGAGFIWNDPLTDLNGSPTVAGVVSLRFVSIASCTFKENGAGAVTFDPDSTYSLSTTMRLFALDAAGTAPADYQIGEVVVYNNAISAGDETALLAYFADKWGTP